MSLYRLSASIVGRGNTARITARNAVAAAGYNAREALFDQRQNVMRDIAADPRELIRADVLLPDNAPERWLDREVLWNEVERRERRIDAQLARSIVVTLPRDLTTHENVNLARDFFLQGFVARGMVADVAVHEKVASDGFPQPHAHALLTMRRIVAGEFGPKEIAWNTAAMLQGWRETWAKLASEKLLSAGGAPIDHRARGEDWIRKAVQNLRAPVDAIRSGTTELRTDGQEWVRTAVQSLSVPIGTIRSQAAREVARARRVFEIARPVVLETWRRLNDWADRRREPMSRQDAAEQLRDALWKRGLRPPGEPILDGKWHRVAVEGDTGHKKSGSYIAYGDGRPAGYIQNFKSGEHGSWKADGTFISDPAKLAAAQQERRQQREQGVAAASDRAATQWARARVVETHPYLERKGVDGSGARVTARGDLLVPMRDADGKLWGVQTITPNGAKFFPKDGKVIGTHALIGEVRPGETVVVVEGWATAKTIHAETGRAVAAAFNAGNMEHVARAYRDRGHPIVVGGDNDNGLTMRVPPLPNVGLEKAAVAAAAVGGKAVVPSFGLGDAGTDWNDYARLYGAGAVRRAFEREGLSMSDTKTVAAVPAETTQAQREAARQNVPLLAQAVVSADIQAQQASARAQTAARQAHSVAVA